MAEEKKKVKLTQRIARWWREMRSELKKVVWPTPKQTLNNAAVVVVMVVIVGAVIGLFDWIATMGVNALIGAFH